MIDDIDGSESTLRLLVYQALKAWRNEALLKLLMDDDCIVRTGAARELQTRGCTIIFEEVSRLIHDDRPVVREIAAFTLGQLGTPKMPFKDRSIPLLVSAIEDESEDVRAASAAALGHLCYETMPFGVENLLIKAAEDSHDVVKSCAAYALGNSSGSNAVRKTLERLRKETSDVSSYAELGMEILKERSKGNLT